MEYTVNPKRLYGLKRAKTEHNQVNTPLFPNRRGLYNKKRRLLPPFEFASITVLCFSACR